MLHTFLLHCERNISAFMLQSAQKKLSWSLSCVNYMEQNMFCSIFGVVKCFGMLAQFLQSRKDQVTFLAGKENLKYTFKVPL